jgi:hypothetical protein
MVLVRALAMSIQANKYPLELPIMAPLLQGQPPFAFCWENMVIKPFKAAQSLGIDIFANNRYDMWVLRTLWYVPTISLCSQLDQTAIAPSASANWSLYGNILFIE